jgi:hypothetical protein
MCFTEKNADTIDHGNRDGGGLVCFTFTAAGLLMLLGFGITSIPQFLAIPTECHVSNVSYPTEINTNNFSPDNPDFVRCDCGRNCMSDLGYCIRVFVSFENYTSLAYNSVSFNPFIECTIAETDCFNGASIEDRKRALAEAAEMAQPYVNASDSNSTIPCYELNGNLFIQNSKDSMIETLSILGGLTFVFLMFTIMYCRQ